MAKMENYTAKDIDVLEGLDAVRHNPSVYLGKKESQVFHCLKEVFENSIDVYLKGMNNFVSVHLDKEKAPQTFTVIDNGPGIPIEKHEKTKISTLTTVMTTLHAGSNFKKKQNTNAISRGVHGVGVSCVNAVSNLTVWTCRNNQWYTQSFEKGKPITDVEECKFPAEFKDFGAKKSRGTIVQYTPDYSILPNTTIKERDLLIFLKNSADLNKGLTVRFVSDKSDEIFCNERGIITLLDDFISTKKKIQLIGKPFIFESDFVNVAIQWSSLEGEHPLSYVNGSLTKDGGSHVEGLYNIINKSFKAVAGRGIDFSPSDLREGLIAVIHYKCNDDDYTGQDKSALDAPSAVKIVADTLAKPLSAWVKANSKLVREISQRATQIKAAKAEARAITRAASSIKVSKKVGQLLGNKLIQCNKRCNPENVELFLVEGDSASGCLFPSTEVKTTKGNKSFAQIIADADNGINYNGYAYDINESKFVEVPLKEPRITKYVDEILEVEMEDGSKILCTPEHLYLLEDNNYTEAQLLSSNDDIRNMD